MKDNFLSSNFNELKRNLLQNMKEIEWIKLKKNKLSNNLSMVCNFFKILLVNLTFY